MNAFRRMLNRIALDQLVVHGHLSATTARRLIEQRPAAVVADPQARNDARRRADGQRPTPRLATCR